MKQNSLKSVFVALFAAIVSAGGFIAVPAGIAGVPIVLQNMLAVLSGAILGGLQGGAAVGLFLAAGALGLPVFSGGRGGMAHLLGPTGGFLIGYFIAALAAGFFIGRPSAEKKTPVLRIAAGIIIGFILIYIPGIIQFISVKHMPLTLKSLSTVLAACVLPYLPGDAIKIAAAIPLAAKLRPIAAQYLFSEQEDSAV